MNSIRVNILGRAYPLRVEAGEEKTMMEIAEYVDERFRIFKSELTTQPEQTIMVLACLSIAEELFSARRTADRTYHPGKAPKPTTRPWNKYHNNYPKLLVTLTGKISILGTDHYAIEDYIG